LKSKPLFLSINYNLKEKVLIIRFNSIGDIVLTTPVVDALYAKGYEVHYLVKSSFASLLTPNPNIFKVWELQSDLSSVIANLKLEDFDFIIDLHNNLRSSKVKRSLKVKSYTFDKPRIKYFLLTRLGIRLKPEPHIVNRFLSVIKPIVGSVKNAETTFFFNVFSDKLDLEALPKSYIVIAVGAAFKTKTIPTDKLAEFINKCDDEIVLIGGADDVGNANLVVENSNRKIINLVGVISLSDSARVVHKSKMLITGDTGMMHIGAALDVPMINIFGSTHQILGYTPFYGKNTNKSTIIENTELSCRPCTKQGRDYCPKGHFKCMNAISVDQMLNVIQ